MNDSGFWTVKKFGHLVHPPTKIRVLEVHEEAVVETAELLQQVCPAEKEAPLAEGNAERLRVVLVGHGVPAVAPPEAVAEQHAVGRVEHRDAAAIDGLEAAALVHHPGDGHPRLRVLAHEPRELGEGVLREDDVRVDKGVEVRGRAHERKVVCPPEAEVPAGIHVLEPSRTGELRHEAVTPMEERALC